MTQEQRFIPIKPMQPVQPVADQDFEEGDVEEVAPPRPKHSAAHLFETPNNEDNDIYTNDLTDLSDEDVFGGDTDMSDLTEITDEEIFGGDTDMSDLTQVTQEQVYGRPNRKKRTSKPARRPGVDTSLGGMNV